MADAIVLTRLPVRVTVSGATMSLAESIDVSKYDLAEFLLQLLALTGTSPTIQIDIITGMQKESEDGWVIWASFTSQSSAPAMERKTADRPFKYIRWKVTTLGGTSPTATFYIDGMVRTNGWRRSTARALVRRPSASKARARAVAAG